MSYLRLTDLRRPMAGDEQLARAVRRGIEEAKQPQDSEAARQCFLEVFGEGIRDSACQMLERAETSGRQLEMSLRPKEKKS